MIAKFVKRAAMLAACLLVFQSCILLNVLHLNPGHEKGDVAGDRIIDAAIVTDLVNSMIVLRTPMISIFSFIADDLAGIDPGKYYRTSEVDACVDAIGGMQGDILGSLLTNLLVCDIKADNVILGPP